MQRLVFRVIRKVGGRMLAYGSNAGSNVKTNGELWLQHAIANECNVVIDVGANIGRWSRNMSAINPGLRIICVEAIPQFANAIKEGFPKVEVLNLALSNTSGALTVYKAGGGVGSKWVQEKS